ncbi:MULTISPECIES: efflux RND transporter periplasmic adaptor subunit [unclassified Colwellia]|jgi:membrane fusion protein (multidrug efflux system)|uniref:efflux RND transporter periplasmic adaptor subunit n=1 Tax=unclassified Colwellia TaxID=196834 RepID=UPI0015F63634|nr:MULTISPECIES: efflux RND transporter periplasmic adaptor subunit [unclassified Colwellia]MBA6381280.1 efflux RND transporter periplasmic adaptor subunit [Colwellia sp. BRX10-7]MBA6389026.1 efflux RND transporter periplasmic adaptor subunit [Colwellia sp. BRX10-2]MBA6403762.1 efflux RND transporter periplasmic adaptor subunit [Colwellia sp. BRX10-5]MBA6407384.1 efflux RND transporter periplasmic adaptor subunit [Colwellia sp. BRX10-1]
MSNKSVPTAPTSTSTFTNRLPLLILVAILVVLIVYLQWPEAKQEESKFERVVAVKMVPVVLTEFIESVEAVGTARANEQVIITSKYSDLVDEINFDDGQKVKKGAVLVKLNNQEELAKVNELTANLSESQAHLTRLTKLLSSNTTSKSLVEQQEAKTKAIEAQLVSANSKVNDLIIRAPFAGVLGFREVSKGAYLDAGDIITSLDDLSSVKVDFHLPERLLTHIHVGQQVTAFNSAYQGKEFIGEITAIDSRIDASTRSIKVRATLNNKALKLRPGMLLNISVLLQVENILQLPESSIIPIENIHYVFIVRENKAVRKAIKIGRRHPGVVEVISGLVAGEEVVVEGALKLRDGSAVSISGQKAETDIPENGSKT